ncbi:MAG: CdaR family protein [Desulfobulbaceae bacterium]|nr:CdaR family protein [Desulfobulbaceae bacterium]
MKLENVTPGFIKPFSKDLLLKGISLGMAVLLWYFVVGEDQVDMNIKVPIEIINLPSNLVISNQFKKDIEVTLRGPRSLISDLKNRNITIPVDLSDKKAGTAVVKNDPQKIPLPSGITILRLQPTNITLTLDELAQKLLVIEPQTHGDPATGYILKKISLEPDHLVISGPKSVLDMEESLKTYIIDLDGLNHSTSLQVHLDLPPVLIEMIGETVVTADIEVDEKFVERVISNIPVNVRDSELPIKVRPGKVSVRALIAENLLRDTPEPTMLFRAFITVDKLKEEIEVPVSVNGVSVPGHSAIKVLSIEPENVRVSPNIRDIKPKSDSPPGEQSSESRLLRPKNNISIF